MDFDQIFATASQAALLGWIAVIAPRWSWLVAVLRYGLVGALALAYAALVFVFFFRAEGGGFNDIAQVRALFASDPVLVAGWIHYLAFDLFVGIWIAVEADARGMNRLLQVPILLATFMFGPVGLLMFYCCRATSEVFPNDAKGADHVHAYA